MSGAAALRGVYVRVWEATVRAATPLQREKHPFPVRSQMRDGGVVVREVCNCFFDTRHKCEKGSAVILETSKSL